MKKIIAVIINGEEIKFLVVTALEEARNTAERYITDMARALTHTRDPDMRLYDAPHNVKLSSSALERQALDLAGRGIDLHDAARLALYSAIYA